MSAWSDPTGPMMLRLTVERLLAECTEEERDLLQLRFVEGKTWAEIGDELGAKYPRGERDELTGSGARYKRDMLYARLRRKLAADGLHSLDDLLGG